MKILHEIRSKISNGQFEFSQHAADQAILRRISVQEFRDALESPNCLVLGHTRSRRPLHIQCSHPSRALIKVTTLYEPDPLKWIDFRERRSRHA